MKTVLIFLIVFGFMLAFCAFYWIVEKTMNRVRRRIARKMIMRRHGLIYK